MIHDALAISALGLVSFAATAISETTNVPLGPALSVGVSVAGAVWWLSRKFQKMDDRLDIGSIFFEQIRNELSDIRRRLDSLPCEKNDCQDDSK